MITEFRQNVNASFVAEVKRLAAYSFRVASDSTLLRSALSKERTSIASAFARLDSMRPDDGLTIDIVDTNGSILAWSGTGRVQQYEQANFLAAPDTIVIILHHPLHAVLCVGVINKRASLYVVTSEILDSKWDRNVSTTGGSSGQKSWAERYKAGSVIVPVDHPKDSLSITVPLRDFAGKEIALLQLPAAEVQSLGRRLHETIGLIVVILKVLTLSVVSILLILLAKHIGTDLIFSFSLVLSVWMNRICWRLLNFPDAIVGGNLFDPSVYASPYWLGLSSSLGDLLLTIVALAVTSILLFRSAIRSIPPQAAAYPYAKVLAPLLMLTVVLLFGWLSRGLAEVIRSIIFDSTIRFQNPYEVVPDFLVAVGYLVISSTAIAYVGFAMTLFVVYRHLARSMVINRALSGLVQAGIAVVGLSVFILVDGQSPISPWLLIVHALIIIVVGVFLERSVQGDLLRHSRRVLVGVWFIGFLVSIPLLDQKLHEKERQNVELITANIVRPIDSWHEYLLRESFKTLEASLANSFPTASSEEDEGSIAFFLWQKSLLHRQGVSTLIALYNREGKEIDRFSLGFNSFEQQEGLTELFAGEEGFYHPLMQSLPQRKISVSGVWGFVRSQDGAVVGSTALMLGSPLEPTIAAGSIDPLRKSQGKELHFGLRELSVSEYLGNKLIRSTMPGLSIGSSPSEAMRSALKQKPTGAWTTEIIGGKAHITYVARDPYDEDRLFAVRLEEIDIRWHVFWLIKIAVSNLLMVLVIGGIWSWRIGARQWKQGLSFRTKLFLAFATLSVLPLIIIGIYNQRVAEERVRASLSASLASDLNTVVEKIYQYVSNDEDFERGVNNDFCEAIAADLRIDFSVFGMSQLKATSVHELFISSLLDRRLSGKPFSELVLLQKPISVQQEQIDGTPYLVGYKPIIVGGRVAGVVSLPTIFRQQEVEDDLAERNAFLIAAYGVVFVLMVIASAIIARRFTRPIRDLTRAAEAIGQGNLNVSIPIRSSDEIGVLVRTFDRMVEELKTNRAQLIRAERELAWKEMAKQVAHEIKNPLTPIKLSLQHLRQAFKDRHERREELLEQVASNVMEQVDALSRIASEFSNFGRLPEARYEQLDIHQLIRECLQLFQQTGNVEFRFNLCDVPFRLIADKDALRRALINIVRNGIQAMNANGTLTVSTEVRDQSGIVRIHDTGPGIPDELREKVFTPNFSTKSEGMGLGLAITRNVIENLNGTVSFESARGKGTTFILRFPL
ncbi:MAG: HAMP domain-containing protein [Ignavibacteriales bacterium]|nr:HAMP domain-containing protein [Ignavibacteriales bacterium]